MAYNHVTLVGRLVAAPELRRTGNGKAVTSFRLAVDRPTTEKQTDFLDVVAWEQRAEFAVRNFTKGQEVLVDGELQTRSWTDKEGNKRVAVEVRANMLRFVGSRAQQDAIKVRSATSEDYDEDYGQLDDDEELPF